MIDAKISDHCENEPFDNRSAVNTQLSRLLFDVISRSIVFFFTFSQFPAGFELMTFFLFAAHFVPSSAARTFL